MEPIKNINSIEEQYQVLKSLNQENSKKLLQMQNEYKDAVKVYEDLQAEMISDDVEKICIIAKRLFPDFIVKPTKFGIRFYSMEGISENGGEAENENSGLGDYESGERIYKILTSELGPIIKTTKNDIAWFEADEDSKYDEKTSWVYTMIEYQFKKTYLNEKFNFKSAPAPKV
jgi:hypothetical protein